MKMKGIMRFSANIYLCNFCLHLLFNPSKCECFSPSTPLRYHCHPQPKSPEKPRGPSDFRQHPNRGISLFVGVKGIWAALGKIFLFAFLPIQIAWAYHAQIP